MNDRQSNFELLRLIAMLMVMVCHAVGYVTEADLVGTTGVAKLAANQFCLVSVNVFVMISGWFGIKASWKGAAKLLFQVVFVALLCLGVFGLLGLPVSFTKDLLPYLLFGYGYWFVVSYLILYALSPVLNSFVESASQKEFIGVLLAFFGAEFVFGFLLDAGHFDSGFSPLFFIGLYLLARFAKTHPGKLFSLNKWTDFAIYFGASVLSMFGFWFGYKWFGMGFHLNHYDSPLAIIASLYFLLFFSKLEFQSRFVNWMAASAFAIYLIHTNSLVYPYFRQCSLFITENHSLIASAGLLLVFTIVSAFLCILVDKPRILLWGYILKCLDRNRS